MKLRELLEEEDNIAKVTNYIKKKYNENTIAGEVDNEIENWLEPGWDDEYEDEFEWYSEFGGGEAEDAVINNIKSEAERALKIKLSVQEGMKVYSWMKNKYNLAAF